MGHYILRYFPEKNVRYVALNDEIDTFVDNITNDYLAFKLSYNDLYPKDTSRKVRNVFLSKKMNGEFIGAFVPYGYQKDPANKNKLVIDPETAPVVKRIFMMYLDGLGYTRIANTLESEGIMPPTAYKALTSNYKNPKAQRGYWTEETIRNILISPTYEGNLTQNKRGTANYKLNKLKTLPQEEWIIVPNTHEAIIEEEAFGRVQERIAENPVYLYKEPKCPHLLTGLLFCGDCGHRITFYKSNRNQMYCICSNYKRFRKRTRHGVRENALEALVIRNCKRSRALMIDQERLMKIVQKTGNESQTHRFELEINRIQNELESLKRFTSSLYEDKVKVIIDEEYFIEQFQGYSRKRDLFKERLKEAEYLKNQSNKVVKW
jgi:hypothetical protein